jgi:hypothetical protein
MDDDVVLRADVFRPEAPGRYPAIVTYGPYGKDLAFADGYPDQWRVLTTGHPDVLHGSSGRFMNWETPDPERWVPDGYACVRVDSRGAGRSPGVLDPFSPREVRDFHDCVEWAARQPWCTGRVGTSGISYYAMNQWRVAALNPPHLVAMCVWEGAADFYRDVTYHGGILSTFRQNWYGRQVTVVQHGRGERGPRGRLTGEPVSGPETLSDAELEKNRAALGDDIGARPLDGPYYRERSADFAKVTVPFLSAGNWGGQGLHLRGNVEAFTQAAAPEKWLELHGLEHWTSYYTDEGMDLQKRFFRRFLHEDPAGWKDQPAVSLQVRHTDGFEARGEDAWPLPRTRWTRWALWTSPVSYAANGDGATFMGPPLRRATELTGPLAARLFVSSDVPDADLFVVVRLFGPDGTEVTFQGAIDPHTPVAQGWLRMSHRALDPDLSREYRPYHRHDATEPLVPGEIYQADVEIWPTSIVIPAGHRLAVTVRGRDYTHPAGGARLGTFANALSGCGPFVHDDARDRPGWLTGGTQTLHPGGHVLLPVIPPKE